MEINDDIRDEKQSLEIIGRMIENARQGIQDNGFFYLLWRHLVIASTHTHYVLQYMYTYRYPWLSWAVLMPAGGIVSMIYGMKMDKKQGAKTYIEKNMMYVLVAFLVSLLIVLFMMPLLRQNTYPLVLVMYGIWLFCSGGMLRFRPLIAGGVINWFFGILAFYQTFEYQLILLAAAVLIGYIIPGHLLNMQYKKNVRTA